MKEWVIYSDRLKSYFNRITRIGIEYGTLDKAATYPTKYKAKQMAKFLGMNSVEITETSVLKSAKEIIK